jgi:transcriptional regulator with XRE-family HTH domain
MKERLVEFLRAENKSSAQFAEEIGVQPSGISHILSGRNNPSLDFVLKMLEKYQYLSTDWLLFGKGSMYKEGRMQGLFDEDDIRDKEADRINTNKVSKETDQELPNTENTHRNIDSEVMHKASAPSLSRIVWFYDNNSFEEYFPRQ